MKAPFLPHIGFLLLFFGLPFLSFAQEKNLDVMSLSEFRETAREEHDGPWVIDFWASWCGPCIQSMPELKQLHKRYAEQGVRFISLSWDRDEAAWRSAAKRLNMNWTHVFLGANRNTPFIDKYFKHRGIPAIFLVRPDGKIKRTETWKLEKQLEKLL